MSIGILGIVLCDFCSEPGLRDWWLYPCESFEIPEAHCESTGGWVACDRCAPYVERTDWHGLAAHVLAVGALRTGRMPDPWQALYWIRRAWPAFAAHRLGPRARGSGERAWRN